ncbi:hypothetical protein DFP73DRAFT_264711 [Morchella snyderi]|nr:hypothetical protein DFP73DRAFT_264711 [Morchella snyderi]
MTIDQKDARSGKPIVHGGCREWWLHGKLIENLLHNCSHIIIMSPNRKGKAMYKKKVECGFPKCQAVFRNARGFYRHYRTVHIRATDQKIDCTIDGCRRTGEEGFTRKDNLIQHMRSVHGEEIPKNPIRFHGLIQHGTEYELLSAVKGALKSKQEE